jgi:hypothetical protein
MLGELTTEPGVEGSSGYKKKYLVKVKEAKGQIKIINVIHNYKQSVMPKST